MKRYIMIGAPVTKVRTPPLLKAFLFGLGTDADIEARPVDTNDLDAFMKAVQDDASIDGLLVTMPHKRAVIPYLEAISTVARQAGSVNSVKRLASGALVGGQFDGAALVNALRAKGARVDEARILLAGVGGAGLAIAQAIATHGCQGLMIADLNSERRDATVAALNGQSRCTVSARRGAGQDTFDLLINATPLGMRDGDPSPFEPELVSQASWIADIVADPPATHLAALARAARITLITGRDMVDGQVKLIGRWLLSQDVEQ